MKLEERTFGTPCIVFENVKQKNGHVYIYFQIDVASYKSGKDLECIRMTIT